MRIEWDYVADRIDVRAPSALDRRAMEFMGEGLEGERKLVGANNKERHRFREQLYTEFLQRFPESTYAPEIKWHLAKVVARRLGHQSESLG